MRECYSTVKENGIEYARQVADELRKRGLQVLSINPTLVPRGENIYVEGYCIVTEDGRPPYRSPITGELVTHY